MRAMLYESYELRVKRQYSLLKLILKYKTILIVFASVVSFLFSGYSVTKGIVYDVTVPESMVFGSDLGISSKSFFSEVEYTFRTEGEESWNSQAPLRVGNYQVQIVTTDIFGNTKTHVYDFTIAPQIVHVSVQDMAVRFGDYPLLVADLFEGDYFDSYVVQYADLSQTTTSIVGVDAIVVKDAMGNDVTDSYQFEVDTTNIIFSPIEITIKPEDVSKVYDGTPLVSNTAEVVDGELLEGQDIVITTEDELVMVGTSETTIATVHIWYGDTDVTANYEISLEPGTLEVLSRPITMETASAQKTYDGNPLHYAQYQIIEGSLAEGDLISEIESSNITAVGTIPNQFLVSISNSMDADVTNCYDITYVHGELEVLPRPILVQTISASQVYDGLEFSNPSYAILDGSLVEGEHFVVAGQTFITNVGEIDNVLSLVIQNDQEIDLTSNYTISYEVGMLEITPRPITIRAVDQTKIYDGLPLTSNEVMVSSDIGLVLNHTLLAQNEGQRTNVGTSVNTIHYVIVWAGSDNVTDNYEITLDTGMLVITPREITIQPVLMTKVYDGLPLTSNQVEVTSPLGLVLSHEIQALNLGSQMDVGSSENTISEVTIWQGSTNVTGNYSISLETNELVITPRPITVQTKDVSKIYDGLALSSNEVQVTLGSLVAGHTVEATTLASLTIVGSQSNPIDTIEIYDGLRNVTQNYELTLTSGELHVLPRPITIQPLDQSKVYDGTLLTSNEAFFLEGSLADGEEIGIITSMSQLNVGRSENEILEVTISNGLEMTTSNYQISLSIGTLEVTPRPLTIQTSSLTKVYDGLPLFDQDYVILEGSLAPGQSLEIVESSSITIVSSTENVFSIQIHDDALENVIDNYTIVFELGQLEITKRPITLESASATKVYDGLTLENTGYSILEGSFADNQTLTISDSSSILNVGVLDNVFVYEIQDSSELVVTENYDITWVLGSLEITPRPLTLESASATKVYDGLSLSSANITATEGSFAQNEVLIMTSWPSITEVRTIDNAIVIQILNASQQNVTSNYAITYVWGQLEITPRPITLLPIDQTKVYDGTALTSNEVIFTSELILVEGHTMEVVCDGSQTNVGSSENDVLRVHIYDGTRDVTSNYLLSFETGQLTVTARPLTIETASDSKIYDGTILQNPNYQFLDDTTLADYQVLTIEDSTSILNVGTLENAFVVVITNEADEDVTSNYAISYEKGLLEIFYREITIVTGSSTKVYDGLPLTDYTYEITNGSLADQQRLEVQEDTAAFLTHVGTEDNHYDVKIFNLSDEDVTSNYAITFEMGLLEVLVRPITIETGTSTKVYDGLPLIDQTYTITEGSLADGQSILILESSSILEVGNTPNVFDIDILDALGDVVSDNYLITWIDGSLTIEYREITIDTGSSTKIYDGTPLTDTSYDITIGSLADGQHLVIKTSSSITNHGEVSNHFEIEIQNNLGVDVSKNYIVSWNEGTLTIEKRLITVETASETKVYDGLVLTNPNFVVTEGSLAPEQELIVTESTSILNVSSADNVFSIKIIAGADEDVIDNYIVTYVLGTLEITPRPITLETSGAVKIYDGSPLHTFEYTISSGSLAPNQGLEIAVVSEITNVGTTDNVFTYMILNQLLEDVTSNYLITEVYGVLEIQLRPLTIASVGKEQVYDGTALSNLAYLIAEGSLAPNQTIHILDGTSIIDVDTVNNILTIQIFGALGNDVTANYDLGYQWGELVVTPRPILLQPTYVEREYNELPLTSNAIDSLGPLHLVEGHVWEVVTVGSQTVVGESANTIFSVIIWDGDRDVTNNYAISTLEGTLKVLPRKMTIETGSSTKVYDGTPLTNLETTVTSGSLVDFHTIQVTGNASITNVGSMENLLSVEIHNALDEDVTMNYEISWSNGTLTIEYREITIDTGSSTKVYDGTPLTDTSYDITVGSLADGQNIVIVSSSSITNFGETPNAFDIEIHDAMDQDVSDNYLVSWNEGTLTIEKRAITVETGSSTKVYDGTMLSDQTFVITEGSLVEGQTFLVMESSAIFDVSSIDNLFWTIKIIAGADEEVQDNYDISYTNGTLTITPRPITIETATATKVYDNTMLYDSHTSVLEGSLVSGHQIHVTDGPSITTVGVISNTLTLEIWDDQGINVSGNYDITMSYGELSVTPRPITVTSNDAEKIYDGSALTNPTVVVTDGSLVFNHEITVHDYAERIDAGSSSNVVTILILDSMDQDMTSNYEITYLYGTLTITPRPVVLQPTDVEKIYDETELSSILVETTGEWPLVDGHHIEAVTFGGQTNVGTSANSILSVIIYDGTRDVTSNYDITFEQGSLTVLPRPITILSGSSTKMYDGTLLSDESFTITSGSLVNNHSIQVTTSSSILNVGIIDNAFTVLIHNALDTDVTSNYDITYVWGQLEVTVRPITIETGSASKVYDGTSLSDTSYTITDGSLATNQTIEILSHSSITNVGSTDNLFVIEIWDHVSQDVSSNYDITFVHGTLSISPRPVTITSATDTKVYDGVVFSNDEVLVTEGTIASEQTIVVLSSATILNVGTRSNTFTMEIHDALDQDVTANYDITFVYGVLEITPRVITIQTNSNSKVYDGTPLSDSGFTIIDGSLAEEQSFVFVDGVSITNVGVIDNVISIEIHNVFNENVISNYDITYVYGTLEVTPRPITIESATDQKIYDGTPLSNSNVTIISGSLVEGHILTVTDSNAITNVGYDGNPFHITITDDQLVDMIGNYAVSYHLGSLTVLPRPITIETNSNEKFYDGTPLSDSTYALVSGTLAEGQSIQVIDSSSITEVGIIDNEFFLKIFDSENEDVTSNYEITWTLGTLEILKREVWLTSDSAEKTYDGTPLSQPTVSILDGQLVPGHTIGTYNFTSYVGPGNTTNILSVDIFDAEGRNVTSSYEIHLEYGVLVVNLIELVVTTPDDTKIYDGTPLTNSNWELTTGALLQGHDLYVSVTGTITDIGQTFNRFTYYILDENSVDVTQYYQVSENIGILEVISGKEDLILKSGTDSKDYDGTPLTNDSWEFIECELLPGHTITVTVTGTITEVGETDNVFTFQIFDEANQDVTDTMYNVTPVYGNLTIFDGDGNGSNQDSSIEITPEGWFEGASNSDGTLFKINSEVSGLIYLRQRSFGDYNKTGWDAPIVYESPYGISPFLFPYLASQGEVSSYLIQLRAYVRGLSYYLPYFATDGLYDNINDVYASHSYGIGYDINYIPQGELDYTAYSLQGTEYEAYELEYRDFVYQHYLQLPADTEYELLKIASQNGLDASSATIIEDVQNFVLNAAVYNLQYKPFPENSDYVIYFLEQAHEGICQHFAMAATLMYRAMGIPARYVVGYVTAAGANEWVDVSTKQAHAWTEIYIDGFGWVQIETTPSAAGTTGGMAFDMKMTSFDSKKETLVITSGDASKTYDGLPLTNELYRFEGTLQSGHTLVVDGFASITKVGEIDNEFSVHVEDAQGNDVSNLYDLVSVYGKLYVMPDNGFEIIEIKLYDNTVTYDGTLHTATTAYYIPSRNLPAGYTVSFEVYGQIQNVGVVQTAINRPTLRIFNELGADVTNQYNIAFYDGSIKVAPRSITVALIPVQQYYDGTELTSDLFYIAKGSLVSGDTISITVSGSIIEVGIEDNRITDVTILNGEGVDVTNNYKVTTKDSTLTVLPD